MIKLNTDGARKAKSLAGNGGLLCDHEGAWKGGFAMFVGSSSAILVEFLGVYEGLKLTKGLDYTKVEINVDSIEVVIALEEGVMAYVDCVAILSYKGVESIDGCSRVHMCFGMRIRLRADLLIRDAWRSVSSILIVPLCL